MYRVLFLVLNILTGEPVDGGRYDTKTYDTYEECAVKGLVNMPPQRPEDGKIKVFTCGIEKEISII